VFVSVRACVYLCVTSFCSVNGSCAPLGPCMVLSVTDSSRCVSVSLSVCLSVCVYVYVYVCTMGGAVWFSLFARTEPKHKQDLVKLLQTQGEICAMVSENRACVCGPFSLCVSMYASVFACVCVSLCVCVGRGLFRVERSAGRPPLSMSLSAWLVPCPWLTLGLWPLGGGGGGGGAPGAWG
jgi:hypothetical protein